LAIVKPQGLVEESDLPEKFQKYTVPEGMVLDLVMSNDESLTAVSLPVLKFQQPEEITKIPPEGLDLKQYLSDLESNLIQQALDECNGVVAHAAKLLKMRRTTLVEKLRKYDLRNVEA
jgi:sigma-54 specific flagellar transcriptional regulator A